ncbi:hypothetical protein M0802_007226 [Mischocyttarus mexicanus]|nr:hypothetical protein M0802_007226 [Mischocyttarus mexicanus]
MIIRRMIWPRTFSDFASMVFILTIVPLIYWFELWIVLPALYKYYTIPYFCHFILGNFIMLNIVGNFTYAVLCDTSINRTIVPVSTANSKDGWRLCTICEMLAPPRSWHCSTCKTCILKRDHHCIFTGCCVVVGMLFTGILCIYHFQLVLNGCVADESNKNRRTYDLGWRQNIKEVLGERWYLTWLVPYIKSQLPHNGITWDTKCEWKINNPKSK